MEKWPADSCIKGYNILLFMLYQTESVKQEVKIVENHQNINTEDIRSQKRFIFLSSALFMNILNIKDVCRVLKRAVHVHLNYLIEIDYHQTRKCELICISVLTVSVILILCLIRNYICDTDKSLL